MKNLIHNSKDETCYNLTLDKIPVPITEIADITQHDTVIQKQDNTSGKIVSIVKKEQGLFIKKYYEISETFKIKDLPDSNNSKSFLTTHLYELLLPFMSEGVLEDLIKESENYYNGKRQSILIKNKYFDKVYYLEEAKGFYSLFVKKGRIVEHVTYCGNQPYDIVLRAIEKSFNNYKRNE